MSTHVSITHCCIFLHGARKLLQLAIVVVVKGVIPLSRHRQVVLCRFVKQDLAWLHRSVRVDHRLSSRSFHAVKSEIEFSILLY